MTQTEYRREYKRRFAMVARARARGFDDHKAALVALKMLDLGFKPEEVRQVLYFGAENGFFGVMKCRAR